jgi:protein-L-isoaspartate(D-aspartate) O-methyltransferase
MKSLVVAFLLAASLVHVVGAASAGSHQKALERMLQEIEADTALTARQTGRSSLDDRVLAAMGRVPRHEFVPSELRRHAYDNRPLPIGYGQTISQPYIVALMTDLLALSEDARVLEIGTGSGYQAAVLAELGARVFTIEIIPELGSEVTERFARLGYDEVTSRVGDGYYGWEEEGPFEAIIVTAASPTIPPPLIAQLEPGGVMVIPVGSPFSVQQLTLVEKDETGVVRTRQVLPVAFVPLTGGGQDRSTDDP